MKRIQVIVSGKVQGVFYRDFVKQNANRIGVKGFVRNLPDGTVKIVADVTPEQEKELVKLCWKGPMMAFVKAVDVTPAAHEEDFDSFDVR